MRTLIPTLLILAAGGLAAADGAPPAPAPAPVPVPADGKAKAPALTVADLPEAVRAALLKQADGAEIERVRAEEKKGEKWYSARWTKDEVKHELRLAADGRILKMKAERKSKDGSVSIAALPEAVRKAIEARLAGGQVAEVEQEEEDGKTVYGVEIATATGRLELEVGADGTILEEKVKAEAEKGKGEKAPKEPKPPKDKAPAEQGPAPMKGF